MEPLKDFPQVFQMTIVLHEVTTRRGLVMGLLDFGCTWCIPCVRLTDGSLVDFQCEPVDPIIFLKFYKVG
jgi:thiol-disulfide isomerase/thioredoxin